MIVRTLADERGIPALALTDRGAWLQLQPVTPDLNDWERWKAETWNALTRGLEGYPGLAPLEQYMLRSQRERRCIDCGAPGTVPVERTEASLVKTVAVYYHCDGCAAYWAEKYADTREEGAR